MLLVDVDFVFSLSLGTVMEPTLFWGIILTIGLIGFVSSLYRHRTDKRYINLKGKIVDITPFTKSDFKDPNNEGCNVFLTVVYEYENDVYSGTIKSFRVRRLRDNESMEIIVDRHTKGIESEGSDFYVSEAIFYFILMFLSASMLLVNRLHLL